MGLLHEIQKIGKIIGNQFTTNTKPAGQEIHFTNNFQKRARSWKLSERDATDAYYHGQEVKPNMKIGKHNGYELGIYNFLDNTPTSQLSLPFGNGQDANQVNRVVQQQNSQ